MTISVVIPTLDEAARIVETVESVISMARAVTAGPETSPVVQAPGTSGRGDIGLEVIVVDGGSEDATCQLARAASARVLETDRGLCGRARQLRLGSEKSVGEVVLFLHADTRLEAGWWEAVEGAMSDPACVGGAFTFRFEERGGWEKWIEWWVGTRVAILGLPYGDQALFIRRSVLERMGGVPIVPIMEDLDVVRGMKQAGRMVQLELTAKTSSRRYRARGPLRTVVWHQLALIGWFLGWDRTRLAARMGR